jgi:uncharacterized membrane protein YccC
VLKAITNGTVSASEHRLRLSVLVVGCGLLILVSLAVPFFQPPFGGDRYWQWLCGVTVLLGAMSLFRRERGALAIVATIVTVAAGGLLLSTVMVPLAYSVAMRLFMPD